MCIYLCVAVFTQSICISIPDDIFKCAPCWHNLTCALLSLQLPSSLNASTSLSVLSACGEGARLCFWHCVNNPPPRALHVFLALSLLLFCSLPLCIFPALFLNASGSHSAFCGMDMCLCSFYLRKKLATFLIPIFHLFNN